MTIISFQDGLLSQKNGQGHGRFIDAVHAQIPRVSVDGSRLQMIVCSATLHNYDVHKMAVNSLLYHLKITHLFAG
jgi:ATP-dependent RNA helicase DDX1